MAKKIVGIPVSVPMPELKDYDRLTVNQNIHHEQHGETPKTFPASYSRLLVDKEDVYQRGFSATEKWAALDLGWFASDPNRVGCVIIYNKEGMSLLVHPTIAERAEINRKILEISYSKKSDESDLVYPGTMDVKWPANVAKLYVRCQSGTALCRIAVISK